MGAPKSGDDELVAIMAHALLNSAAVILAHARLLRDPAKPLTPERRNYLLDGLIEQALFIKGFCDDLARLGDPSLIETLDRLDDRSGSPTSVVRTSSRTTGRGGW